jgi:hypothetical protein
MKKAYHVISSEARNLAVATRQKIRILPTIEMTDSLIALTGVSDEV